MRPAHSPSPEARAWAKAVLGRAADGWMVSPLSARGGVGLRVAEIVVPVVVERLEAIAEAREAALGAADVERERAALAAEHECVACHARVSAAGEACEGCRAVAEWQTAPHGFYTMLADLADELDAEGARVRAALRGEP